MVLKAVQIMVTLLLLDMRFLLRLLVTLVRQQRRLLLMVHHLTFHISQLTPLDI